MGENLWNKLIVLKINEPPPNPPPQAGEGTGYRQPERFLSCTERLPENHQ
nr:hypothetical protein [Alysiella crassa]UOP05779.1 hypothetical protein LVJ80_07665 [Alysiella crassa]